MKRLTTLFLTLSLVICTVSANGETTSDSTPALNHLTMNQWVQVDDNGALRGRIFLPQVGGESEILNNVSVAILARDGEVLQAKTNANGEFQIADVQPGVYALTARGRNAFACCAMHVVDSVQAAQLDFPQQADIAMAGVDYTTFNAAIIRYLPPKVKDQQVKFGDVDLTELKDRVCGKNLFRVVRSASGMRGKLHVAGASSTNLSSAGVTNVFLYREGREVARTISNTSGDFGFENIDTGFYSVFAIGPSGIGLIGFELVDSIGLAPSETVMTIDDGKSLVALLDNEHADCCETFAMQVAPIPEVRSVVEEVIIEEEPLFVEEEIFVDGEIIGSEVIVDGFGSPVVGGGFSPGVTTGGFGGGGGGFGGGGGLAGIAALGSIGAVVAVATDDDNNAIIQPVVVSPVSP